MGDTGQYYNQSRNELLKYIPPTTATLLDIGCGAGWFGAAVKTVAAGCETWGVEPVPAAGHEARQRNDKVIVGDLETAALPENYFDVVTMNDVLEHFTYSEPPLAIARRVLKPGGRLVISLPHVGYYLNIRDLVFRGDWKYQDYGILDRTHLRFFTPKSARRLLDECGYQVSLVEGINPAKLKPHYRLLFALTLGRFDEMRFPQFVFVASRAP